MENLETVFVRAKEWSLEPEIVCYHLSRRPGEKYPFIKFSVAAINMLSRKIVNELGGKGASIGLS